MFTKKSWSRGAGYTKVTIFNWFDFLRIMLISLNVKYGIHLLFFIFAISACSKSRDSKHEDYGVISTIDLKEAQKVRDVLAATDGAKGMYSVEPGATVTTVYIKSPDEPIDVASTRVWMRSIKSQLATIRGGEPNDLKFVFKKITIIE